IDDLIECFLSAVKNIEKTKGQAYNIGGGPSNTLSLVELLSQLEKMSDRSIKYDSADWRPGDQKVYVSDISKAANEFNWRSTITVKDGISRLYKWVKENRDLFGQV
ncbi:MAG: GDP-mannose 4,6-dehydratase, partial [Planctomycetes bacterium]|nr:GDP-mannose 4,6-dehydratase [Planctomycetota bacterium]